MTNIFNDYLQSKSSSGGHLFLPVWDNETINNCNQVMSKIISQSNLIIVIHDPGETNYATTCGVKYVMKIF